MPAPISPAPRKNTMAALTKDGGAGLRNCIQAVAPNVPGNYGIFMTVPEDGYMHSVEFASEAALAADDTNYFKFFVKNLGQKGTGQVDLAAAGNVNTTKMSGGNPVVSNSRWIIKLVGDAEALRVKAGDRILFTFEAVGTVAGPLTGVVVTCRILL